MLQSRPVSFSDASQEDLRRELKYRINSTYRELVWTLRCQGALTQEKQKLMKMVREYFRIPDDQHYVNCNLAAQSEDLDLVACSVGAQNTDLSWFKEAMKASDFWDNSPRGHIDTEEFGYKVADAVLDAEKYYRRTKKQEFTSVIELNNSEYKKFLKGRKELEKEKLESNNKKENIPKDKIIAAGQIYLNIIVKKEEEKKKPVETKPILKTQCQTCKKKMTSTTKATVESPKEDKLSDKVLMPPPPSPPASKLLFPHLPNVLKLPTLSASSSAQPPTSSSLVDVSSPANPTSSSLVGTSAPAPISPLVNKPPTVHPPASSTPVSSSSSVPSSAVSQSPPTLAVDSRVLPPAKVQQPKVPPGVLSHPPASEAIKRVLPSLPRNSVPPPKSSVPPPKSSVPPPKSSVPSPKSAVPSPKNSVPPPKSSVPSPKSSVPPSPKSSVPPPSPKISAPLPLPKNSAPLPSTKNCAPPPLPRISALPSAKISAPPPSLLPTPSQLPTSKTSTPSPLPSRSVPISQPAPILTNITQTVQVSDKPLMSTFEVPSSQPVPTVMQTTPVVSNPDNIQFLTLPDSLESLPPLVIVPPPEPVITVPHSSSFPEPVQASTFILSSGMSIQLKEADEAKKRKRTIAESGGSVVSAPTAPKTLALSQLSKLTPVMVNATALNSQGQMKISAISRITSLNQPTLSTSLATSGQKVIIVANSAGKATLNMRPVTLPQSSVSFPILHKAGSRPQTVQGLRPTTPGAVKPRPKFFPVQAKTQPKVNPVLIPVTRPNLPPKQENVTAKDPTPVAKRLPVPTSPAKILPKPQAQSGNGNMILVNPAQAANQKPTTQRVGSAPPGYRMVQRASVADSLAKSQSGAGAKKNLLIVQKNAPKPQAMQLANSNPESMKKMISNKFVVIQNPGTNPSSKPPPPTKVTKKTIVTKLPPPPIATAKGNNVVVLDLSQEELNHNLSSATIAEILQASGIITSTENSQLTISHPVTTPSLVSSVNQLSSSHSRHDPNLSETTQPEPDPPDQIFTIESDELTDTDLSFIMQEGADSLTSQVLMETESSLEGNTSAEVALDSSSFPSHTESAVAVQHSIMDMPTNMCLEEYSSQQDF